jgi:phosphoribosyl-ATP pyrophosphohydrolase
MSAKIIPLTEKKKSLEKIIEEAIDQNLSHKNPRVLTCLKKEVADLLKKHLVTEPPEFTLSLPDDLSEAQLKTIKENFRQLFSEHNERMIQRSNSIFLDLYLSRLEVCELRYGDRQQQ